MSNSVQTNNDTADLALFRDYHQWLEMQCLYDAAVRKLCTRFDTINDEFRVYHKRNPIHHTESRIKTADSIVAKLKKHGFPVTIESARQNLNDIAGVRVVCCYIDDVYYIEKILLSQPGIRLCKRQDYIEHPNYNGYRSLHLDLSVDVFLSDRIEQVLVKIQIRTVAMDLWASLEHDLRYKQLKTIPQDLNTEMLVIGDQIADIDVRLQDIYRKIQEL